MDHPLVELREAVCGANQDLVRAGLVMCTWGNVSGIDRAVGVVAIKPSGIDYASLAPDDIVLVDLEGNPLEDALRPSSDLPTHLEIYRRFPEVGGIAHTHSAAASSFAQACRPLPCLGTTHADHFRGAVPITRDLTDEETEADYELNTGRLIVETFAQQSPMDVPAVLVARHGPFAWGADPAAAVKNSVVLEACARMAIDTFSLDPDPGDFPQHLLDRHFNRKHGVDSYYGQD
ncbi:MAG: L-ribulose-5-phosphate 4-epimerase AraD [Lentisphaeria bacterium]|nr:L-ribulose-5-phosphate 4-epimerase AraD [Lentisphaeria bacterium]